MIPQVQCPGTNCLPGKQFGNPTVSVVLLTLCGEKDAQRPPNFLQPGPSPLSLILMLPRSQRPSKVLLSARPKASTLCA